MKDCWNLVVYSSLTLFLCISFSTRSVAKEQGLRSRAAFKLTQINRKFPVLEKCRSAVLDLCAAPGGWTQIAARSCRNDLPIVAVDILPIRPIQRNVTTLIGDITTEKCKSDIKRTLKNIPVDLVLHDGAPNVGADFAKDAYLQNEIALHAVRTATQHLVRGGTFITKVCIQLSFVGCVCVVVFLLRKEQNMCFDKMVFSFFVVNVVIRFIGHEITPHYSGSCNNYGMM